MSAINTPRRPRNSYFFHVFKIAGVFQLHVGYKTSKLVIRPLSSSKPEANVKIPFGPVTSCVYRTRCLGTDEEVSEFKLSNNRRQDVAIRDSLLNNLQLGDDNFNKQITSFSTGKGSRKALALYLSVINRSEGFVYHKEGVHEKNGLFVGDYSATEEFSDAGGNIEELEKFIASAKESAVEVGDPEVALDIFRNRLKSPAIKRKVVEDSELPGTSKRINVEGGEESAKLSRRQYVELCEKRELEDDEGLEKSYQSNFCGLGHIPLKNIEIPPQLQNLIDSSADRIEFIKSSIKKRYNPSSSTLVVCPVDPPLKLIEIDGKKKIDFKNQKFYVIQKIKCLKAFKDLDEVGEFSKLYGHKSGEVLCYILKSNSSEVIQFGNLKDNLVTGQFAKKTVPQDLLHHFHCLVSMDNNIKALKVVERMCRLCCIGADESSALLKLCKWSAAGFQKFMKTLGEYESYNTSDVSSTHGIAMRIARGEKLSLSNALLRQLGKCSEIYFLDHCESINSGALSLKSVAESYQEKLAVEKVQKVLCKIADYQTFENLQRFHPGKFEEDILKEYVGAVYSDKVKNAKSVELERYYNFVINSPSDSCFDKSVVFKVVKQVHDVLDDLELLVSLDLIVFNIGMLDLSTGMSDLVPIKSLVDLIRDSNKAFNAAVFLFACELDYFRILSAVRKANEDSEEGQNDIQIWPLIFNRNVQSNAMLQSNVQYGFIIGKFLVLKPPLFSQYSNVSMFSHVVASICPSGSRILSLAHPNNEIIQILNDDLYWKVTYCGDERGICLLKKKLKNTSSLKHFKDNSDKVTELNDADVASTSTTPLKGTTEMLKSPLNTLVSHDVYDFESSENAERGDYVAKVLDFDSEVAEVPGNSGSSLAKEFMEDVSDFSESLLGS